MHLKLSIGTVLLLLPLIACSMDPEFQKKKTNLINLATSEYYFIFDAVINSAQSPFKHPLLTANEQESGKAKAERLNRLVTACERCIKGLIAYPPKIWLGSVLPADKLLFRGMMFGDDNIEKALKRRARTNCFNDEGSTPLIEALGLTDIQLRRKNVALLLNAGANPNGVSVENLTPLHCAFIQYQDDQLAKVPVNKLMESFEIVKLLIERGARAKVVFHDHLHATGVATPLSTLRYCTMANVHLLTYLLAHVYPEDRLLGHDQKSVVAAVIARTKLLLTVNQLHPFILNAGSENKDQVGILELLEPELVQEKYGAQIVHNVAKMFNALAK